MTYSPKSDTDVETPTDPETPADNETLAAAPPGCPAHDDRIALLGPEFSAHPDRVYDRLRTYGPAAPIELAPGVPATLVTSYDMATGVGTVDAARLVRELGRR